MSDKISPVAVIKEAARLIKGAPKAFGLYVAVCWIAQLGLVFFTAQYELDWASINPFFVGGLKLLLGSLFMVVLSNHYVMLQRDVVELLPRRFVGKWIKTFMTMLSLAIAMNIVNTVLVGVVGVFTAISQGALQDVTALGAAVLASCVLLRWSFWLPSIAIGDNIDIVFAAQMAKGHTFRVLIPLFVGFLGVSMVMPTVGYVASPLSYGQEVLLGLFACNMLLLAVFAVAAVAVFSVWYEKFRLRHESLIAEAPTE